MGKKNKYNKPKAEESSNAGGAPPQQAAPVQQQQQAAPDQQRPGSSRQNQPNLDGASGKQQPRPQQQQQPRPQQQQQQPQQRPQQQQQQPQQRPQQQQQQPQQQQQQPQQQQQSRPQQQQQSRPQQQQQPRPQQGQQPQQQQQPRPQQEQQQRPRQQGGSWAQQSSQQQQQQQGGDWSQQGSQQRQRPQQQQQQGGDWSQQRPQQQQQPRPQQGQQQQQPRQQQEEQQRPRQQGGSWAQQSSQQQQQQQGGDWSQQRPQQQQQSRPQQEQQQRPRQQGGSWAQQSSQQQQQQQGGDWSQQGSQQRQRPQQQQQPGGAWSQQGSQQQTHGAVPKSKQQQQQPYQQQSPLALSKSSSTASFTSTASVGSIQRGTNGQRTTVETNYLELDLSKMPSVAYHYDVTITPDRPKKYIRPAFDKFNRVYFGNIAMAFDGVSSFYTVEKMPCDKCEKEVELDDTGSRKITFKIAVQTTGNIEIDLASLRTYFNDRIYEKPMRALQCLEVVLASPCHNKGTRVGRSFFNKPSTFYDLEGGYEMWTGLYQAAILGDKPFLNVDITHKSFPTPCKLVDFIRNNLRNSNLNSIITRDNYNDLSDFLRNSNVVYEPPKCFNSPTRTKIFRVNNVLPASAAQKIFEITDPKTNRVTKSTVADYFEGKGYRLQYPNLNLLHVGPEAKSIYLPMELCSIPEGQALNRKDGQNQVRKMIRYAATSTNVRKDKIMQMLRYFNHNADSKINMFGIRIGTNFIEIPMRILSSPRLQYLNRESVTTFNGSWRMSDSAKFFNCIKPTAGEHKWAIIYSKEGRYVTHYDVLNNFGNLVSSIARQRNVNLAAKPLIDTYVRIDDTLTALKKENYDLVFVVIPRFGTTYSKIKSSAEIKQGILTQCIKQETIEKKVDRNLVLNILLKVNAKLNGTNHTFAPDNLNTLKNVMYLGADVTHPSPDQKHIPSVVGVAASHDEFGACYNMQYRLQTSTVENIEDMCSIFTEHLKAYYIKQKKYPDHVIYYRDGVSDGQFPIVKKNELRGIREACKKMNCSPKLTCIIVVKRHHTRFFPKTPLNPNDRNNKFNNVTPGTVVDRVIVHPNEVQFFMVSHQSIQGTAKPTRYNVIEDDANLNIDLLQSLTYSLCHLFPRCNRVVSYPAPAYLAHLVAFRGRVYLDQDNFDIRNLKEAYNKRIIQPIFKERNPMFFV